MEDIIVQGAELMLELHKHEAKLAPKFLRDYEENGSNGEVEPGIERVVIEDHAVSYYDPYLDPFYVSPFWLAVWLI